MQFYRRNLSSNTKTSERIKRHCRKAHGNTNALRRAKHYEFADYIDCQALKSRDESWFGVTIRTHHSFELAHEDKLALISTWGIRKLNGVLFNRSLRG